MEKIVMDDKRKKYLKPDAEVVDFTTDDIITISEYTTEGFLEDGDKEKW